MAAKPTERLNKQSKIGGGIRKAAAAPDFDDNKFKEEYFNSKYNLKEMVLGENAATAEVLDEVKHVDKE